VQSGRRLCSATAPSTGPVRGGRRPPRRCNPPATTVGRREGVVDGCGESGGSRRERRTYEDGATTWLDLMPPGGAAAQRRHMLPLLLRDHARGSCGGDTGGEGRRWARCVREGGDGDGGASPTRSGRPSEVSPSAA